MNMITINIVILCLKMDGGPWIDLLDQIEVSEDVIEVNVSHYQWWVDGYKPYS